MEKQNVCIIVPTAEDLWRRILGSFDLQEPLVKTLLRQCICWMIIFLAFHVLRLFCERRQRQARFQKLFKDRQSQSDSERKAVDQLCLHIQSPTTAYNGGAALETPPLVPVSMCVVDDSCGDILDDRRLLLGAASQLHALGEEGTVLQACAGPVVHTKLTRLEPASLCFGDTINTPSTTSGEAAAPVVEKGKSSVSSKIKTEKGKSIQIQLGRWRVFRTSSTGNCMPPFVNYPS